MIKNKLYRKDAKTQSIDFKIFYFSPSLRLCVLAVKKCFLLCCLYVLFFPFFAHAQQELKDTSAKIYSDSIINHQSSIINSKDTSSYYSDTTLWTTYKVQPNNTLFIIAQKYNMKMAELIDVNKLTSYNLVVGQILKVRKKQTSNPEKSGLRSAQHLSNIKHQISSSYHPKYKVIKYKIKTGDTVFSIAKQFDMSKEELMKLNGVATDSLLYILQVVKVKALEN